MNGMALGVLILLVFLGHNSLATQQRKRTFQQRAKMLQLLGGNSGEWLRELIGQVPNWVMFSDVDKCLWLNQALSKKLWVYLGAAICTNLKHNLEPLLNAHKPLAVSSIKISEFAAGDVAPVITGIKFLDTPDAREILLELGLTWSGNPSLMFHITSALAAFQTLDIKVDHFTIFCPLRIAIKPLLPVSPVLGNITLSFIGKPNIDFSLAVAGGTLDMMAIPGLSSFLQQFLRETITSRMVYPNIVTLPLHHIFMHSDRTTGVKRVMTLAQLSHDFGITRMPASAPKKRDEDPVGILSVVISRAEDLDAGAELLGITPSPFVVLSLKSKTENAVQSQVLSSTVNPVWNEHFDLLSYREADELTLTVMDGNAWNRIQQTLPSLMNPLAMLLTATDSDTKELCSLGVATCTTQFLPAHQSVPITFILTGVKSGKVHCKLKWKPFNKPLPPKAMARSSSRSTMEDILNTDAMVSGNALRLPYREGDRHAGRGVDAGRVSCGLGGSPSRGMQRDGETLSTSSSPHTVPGSPRVPSRQRPVVPSSAVEARSGRATGILRLKVVRGINLAPRNGTLLRGSSEALVRVTVAEQRQDRSNVLSTTKDTRALPGCNPHWEQELLFFVADPHSCTVSLTVLDEQLAKHMGTVSMRLGDLLKQAGTHQVHNNWYLEGISQGEVELLLDWKGQQQGVAQLAA